MSTWVALGLLIIAGFILVFRHDAGTIAGFAPADFAGLITSIALLIYFSGFVFSSYRGRITNAVRDIVMWSALCLVLVASYSYRTELLNVVHRVAGELRPAGVEIPLVTAPGESAAVRIRRRSDGHFIARTNINGQTINMIVDTGASTIVLRHEDAKKMGIDTSRLIYSVTVQTANGTSKAARVKLHDVSIGEVHAKNVDALISSPGALHQSLLGMSFLSRLRSYEFSGDFLTLRS